MVSIHIRPCRHPRCQPLSNSPALVQVFCLGLVHENSNPIGTHHATGMVLHIKEVSRRSVQANSTCSLYTMFSITPCLRCLSCISIIYLTMHVLHLKPCKHCLMFYDQCILTPVVSMVVRWFSPEYTVCIDCPSIHISRYCQLYPSCCSR